ncbi:MAG: hypothetical protein QXU20_03835 [Candidatus Woesearchaeota archaeon]
MSQNQKICLLTGNLVNNKFCEKMCFVKHQPLLLTKHNHTIEVFPNGKNCSLTVKTAKPIKKEIANKIFLVNYFGIDYDKI